MGVPSEALVKDFWTAMWEVQYAAQHDNVPGSLRDFGKIANHSFEIWFTRHGVLTDLLDLLDRQTYELRLQSCQNILR